MILLFKKMIIHMEGPICLCANQKLSWTVEQTSDGPSLLTWCVSCGTRLQVPNREFKAVFQFDRGNQKKILKNAETTDYSEYFKRRREGPPS